MKKALSLVFVLALLFSFAGCKEKADYAENAPSHGVVTGQSYKSDYTGLRFTVNNDKWVFSSDEDLAAGCGIDPESYISDFSQVLQNNKTVYDMMATSEAHHMSVLTGFENLTLAEEDPDMKASDYVEKMVDTFVSGINTESMPYTVSDTEMVTLCDHTYARKILTVSPEEAGTEGSTLSQAYYARNLPGSHRFPGGWRNRHCSGQRAGSPRP